jgi:hypothetical protein
MTIKLYAYNFELKKNLGGGGDYGAFLTILHPKFEVV